MSVAKFLKHLEVLEPVFHCYNNQDKNEQATLTAKLKHTLGAPADKAALKLIEETLGNKAGDFLKLYSVHDGFTLYQSKKQNAGGLKFYPAATWPKLTKNLLRGYKDMGLEPDEYPAGILDSLAFAEIPESGNYFTVKLTKPDHGAIFYADHDDYSEEPYAKSLSKFLARIAEDPAKFLFDVGCYTRYSDGKTEIQWIPKSFEAAK